MPMFYEEKTGGSHPSVPKILSETISLPNFKDKQAAERLRKKTLKASAIKNNVLYFKQK